MNFISRMKLVILSRSPFRNRLCDNQFKIMSSISIALQNHECSYADWFRYIEEMSGPDELALYSLSRKYGIHTAVFNKSYVWTTLMNHIHVSDEDIITRCGVNVVFLGPTKYGIIKNIRVPQSQPSKPPKAGIKRSQGKVTCRDGTRHTAEAPVVGPHNHEQEHLVHLDNKTTV